MKAIFEERRINDRENVVLHGTVAFNQKTSTRDCLVQNYSDRGAKIAVADPGFLPDQVDLLINRKGRAYAADIVWRNEAEAGLSFYPDAADRTPIPLDWARRLRDCEAERRALKAQIERLTARR